MWNFVSFPQRHSKTLVQVIGQLSKKVGSTYVQLIQAFLDPELMYRGDTGVKESVRASILPPLMSLFNHTTQESTYTHTHTHTNTHIHSCAPTYVCTHTIFCNYFFKLYMLLYFFTFSFIDATMSDLQRALVHLITASLAAPPNTTNLWCLLFNPDHLTGSYLPGFMVSTHIYWLSL